MLSRILTSTALPGVQITDALHVLYAGTISVEVLSEKTLMYL